MSADPAPAPPECPAQLARAPRAPHARAQARLHAAPASLQGAVAAIICRDIRSAGLDDAQRLTHFAASPLLSLSVFQGFEVGLVEPGPAGAWQPFGASTVIAGSQSQPCTSWAPSGGRGVMVCFTVDAARALLGIDAQAVQDRFVPAREMLAASWAPLLDALLAAPDDAATLAALEHHLAPRWQASQGRPSPAPGLRRLGRHWVERLALQAREWQGECGPRQVERRIKALSGRSLREWQALVRTEGLFFAARDRHESGEPFDWATLAQDEGFADQAHLIRAARRVTGFAPGEFAQRYVEDESFWMYRLWV